MKKLPNLYFEKKLWKKGYLVIGVDEVGRGAFAGPLVVGGVAFRPTSSRKEIKHLESFGINDSKKLTAKKREELEKIIKKEAERYAVSYINVDTINKTGIGKATSIGVRKVVKKLQNKLPFKSRVYLLIDAFYIKYIKGIGLTHQKAIIRGDEKSLSIAAASIIAKVARDNYMKKLARKYPEYGFERHVGYGTEAHRIVIKQFGLTNIHRISFAIKQ